MKIIHKKELNSNDYQKITINSILIENFVGHLEINDVEIIERNEEFWVKLTEIEFQTFFIEFVNHFLESSITEIFEDIHVTDIGTSPETYIKLYFPDYEVLGFCDAEVDFILAVEMAEKLKFGSIIDEVNLIVNEKYLKFYLYRLEDEFE